MSDLTSGYTLTDLATVKRAAGWAGKTPDQYQHDLTIYFAAQAKRPRVYGDYFGVSITGPSKADCDLARKMGFRWIRGGSECGWGDNDLKAQIDVALYAESIGLRFLWCSNLSTHTYLTARLDEWVSYHQHLAQAGVKRFEIGNEWNNDEFFKVYDPTWSLQATWINRAAWVIKTAVPTATVVTGGMSSYGGDDGGTNNRWPQKAVPKLLAQLTPGLIDGVGNHCYSFPEDPAWHWDAHPGWGATWHNRDVAKATTLPIWNTEFGSQSAVFATETERRDHWIKYIAELDDQRRNAGVVFAAHFVHTLRDGSSFIQGQETPTWGIVKADGTAKSPTTEYFTDLLKKPW